MLALRLPAEMEERLAARVVQPASAASAKLSEAPASEASGGSIARATIASSRNWERPKRFAVAAVEDHILRILVVRAGHRRKACRR